MDPNYLALFGYSGIFINKMIQLLTKPDSRNNQVIIIILLIGLAAFMNYYYNLTQYKKDYTNDKTQLIARQTAHTMFILFILGTFIILNNYEFYNFIALGAHSLFIYVIITTSSLFIPSVLLTIYFGIITANSITKNRPKLLIISQLLLFGFFLQETYGSMYP